MSYHDALITYGRDRLNLREAVNEMKRKDIVSYQHQRTKCNCLVCLEWKQTPVGQIALREVETRN